MRARVADHGRAADSVPPSYDRQRPDPVSTINFPENMAEREGTSYMRRWQQDRSLMLRRWMK